MTRSRILVLVLLTAARAFAADFHALKPLLAVPDRVVLREDFTTTKPLERGKYTRRQGTRWTIADGVLRGIPSSAEFQAKKKDHFGYEPRLSIPACPPEFKIEGGKWYRALGEIKGDEFVVQFAGGPTLYGRHASLAGKNDGFGVAGAKGGTVELDNLTVWSVKPGTNPQWAAARATLPAMAPVVVKQKPPAKRK